MVGAPVAGIVAGTTHAATASCVTQAGGQTFCIGSAGSSVGLGAFFVVLIAISVGFAVLGIVAAVKIVTKAGYSGWWVLIALVPLGGAVMVLVFAFSKWPVTQEVETLRAQVGGPGSLGPAPYGPGPYGPAPYGPGAPGPVPYRPAPYGPTPRAGEAPGTPEPEPARPFPPAGWFPTPDGRRRYWDGSAWTDHYA